MIWIDLIGHPTLERNGGKLVGGREGDFDRARAVDLDERHFVCGHAPDVPKSGGDDTGHAARRDRGAPALPGPGHLVPEVEAFDSVCKIAHEVAPAQLAVGEDLEPQLFLPGENAQDVTVFDRPEALGVHRGLAAGLQQFGWSQEAANLVGSVGRAHFLLL